MSYHQPDIVFQRDPLVRRLGNVGNVEQFLLNSNSMASSSIHDYGEPRLMALAQKLFQTRANYPAPNYPLSQALRYQNATDLFYSLKDNIVMNYNGQTVTNGWLKFYEVSHLFHLLDSPVAAGENRKFVTFLNAELPGGALCAYNHFVKTRRSALLRQRHLVRASSLTPSLALYDEADCFSDKYGYWKRNSDLWLMNEENNGDCLAEANLLDFEWRLGPDSPIGGVDLYHHDAATDARKVENYDQEFKDARLHLGCALAGFLTLRPGGSFVAAQFTFFRTFTWNLLLIYATLFDEFYLCKPLASRSRNSEVYLVGKGFRGLPDKLRSILFERLNNFNLKPFLRENVLTDKSYSKVLDEIVGFAKDKFNEQMAVMEQNKQLFERYYPNQIGQIESLLDETSKECVKHWLTLCPVVRLDKAHWLEANPPQPRGEGGRGRGATGRGCKLP